MKNIFAEIQREDKTATLMVRMTVKEKKAVMRFAIANKIQMSGFVRMVLKDFMESHNEKASR